jgi:hypothetical protein
MNKPKTYKVFIPELNPLADTEVFCVDDPALADLQRKAALYDSEKESNELNARKGRAFPIISELVSDLASLLVAAGINKGLYPPAWDTVADNIDRMGEVSNRLVSVILSINASTEQAANQSTPPPVSGKGEK